MNPQIGVNMNNIQTHRLGTYLLEIVTKAVASYSAFSHVLWLFWVQYCLFQKSPRSETLKQSAIEVASGTELLSSSFVLYCWWLQNCLSFAKKQLRSKLVSRKIRGQRTHDKIWSEGLMTCFLLLEILDQLSSAGLPGFQESTKKDIPALKQHKHTKAIW